MKLSKESMDEWHSEIEECAKSLHDGFKKNKKEWKKFFEAKLEMGKEKN